MLIIRPTDVHESRFASPNSCASRYLYLARMGTTPIGISQRIKDNELTDNGISLANARKSTQTVGMSFIYPIEESVDMSLTRKCS